MMRQIIMVLVLLSVSVMISACSTQSRKSCQWVETRPNFSLHGRNVAVVGNCGSESIIDAIENGILEGFVLSDYWRPKIFITPRHYTVIDRRHLTTILKEQGLSVSGSFEPYSVTKLNKLKVVDALIICSDDRLSFVEISSGQVLAKGHTSQSIRNRDGSHPPPGWVYFMAKIIPSRKEVCD